MWLVKACDAASGRIKRDPITVRRMIRLERGESVVMNAISVHVQSSGVRLRLSVFHLDDPLHSVTGQRNGPLKRYFPVEIVLHTGPHLASVQMAPHATLNAF